MKIIGNTITVQQISLLIKGGIMKGALDMANHILKGIPEPTEQDHATNKSYVDNLAKKVQTESEKNSKEHAEQYVKEYADALTFHKSFTIPTSGWSASAPYTQNVAVEGVEENDDPHVYPVFSDDLKTAQEQEEAAAMISMGKTFKGGITFICFEDKPAVDIPARIEVNR